jgi:hypothetical protein
MKKHYEVTVSAVATVYVAEVENAEEAYSQAREVLNAGEFSDLTMTAQELHTESERASSHRHATNYSIP